MALTTVGCRLNQYETEKLANELIRQGLDRVPYAEEADLYILNTCTVTGRADADCRNLISRAYRKNPAAIIAVVGCYVVADRERVAEMSGVDLVVGNDDKHKLPEILRDNFRELFKTPAEESARGVSSVDLPMARSNGTSFAPAPPNRAMVKIGDGCNQRCSYCIVPSVRGELVSYEAKGIIAEVENLIDHGYHEIVLTAVHIGKYKNRKLNLAGLVEKILDTTTLSRLRLSSLEPNELDRRLLELVTDHPRICRHLHLPLQSGSNRILKVMYRPYCRSDYMKQLKRIKKANAEVTIGCDLIVGFPGESDKDFAASLAVLDSGLIDYAHVFSYSDRPGTPASDMGGKISPQIIKEHNRQAREIARRARLRYMNESVGTVVGVISEGRADRDGNFWGVSDNYLKVKLPAGTGGKRSIVEVRPTRLVKSETPGHDGGYLESELAESHPAE
ncbi:MAG: tRNA (N(6)-L-threonylcarbamoyladenosine(37)-C(2))-methylthiotransferase MtaB [FCB group bacterium]|nr:tRNA (N(6)-L-threonylcarbamoyladenosine(37)-C(2))-methylthiotransferase MtaB [FCB group bacterium]